MPVAFPPVLTSSFLCFFQGNGSASGSWKYVSCQQTVDRTGGGTRVSPSVVWKFGHYGMVDTFMA